ncbi:MAG TPA: dihydrodipicolinate reductase C-terminal domain-containing protein [Terriglobales bacterium]|nr:dihydrodipicolinate reductase C-terminal domain-containing protein [Terriglobales bacterium]
MNLLILGRGKTGSLVPDVAHERGHHVRVLGAAENSHAAALTPDTLKTIEVVIDFTAPGAVLENIEACVRAGKNMVVGTTGWYNELLRIQKLVEKSGTGFLYAANFSIGVNLFFEIVKTACGALQHGYFGQIFERHHVHKKDAPSGTGLALQRVVREALGTELEITSFREGEVVGMHELVFDSAADTIYLCHDAKSRRGFAEGAVRGAEWLAGKTGFFDFKDVWREL